MRAALPVAGFWRPERRRRLDARMAGAGSESRFAGLSLVQLNELLEDEGQLTEMVQKMEEVRRAGWRRDPERGPRGRGPRRAAGARGGDEEWEGSAGLGESGRERD